MRQLDLVKPTRLPEGPGLLWGIPQDHEYQRRYRAIQSWCDTHPHDVQQYRTLHVANCVAGCEERWSTHRCVVGLATLDWLTGIRHGVTTTAGFDIDIDIDIDTDTDSEEEAVEAAQTARHPNLAIALAAAQVAMASGVPAVRAIGQQGIAITSQVQYGGDGGDDGMEMVTSLSYCNEDGTVSHVESVWPLEPGDDIEQRVAVIRRWQLDGLTGAFALALVSPLGAPASSEPQTPTPDPAKAPKRRRSKRKDRPEDAPPIGAEPGPAPEAPPEPHGAPPSPPPTVQQLAQWFSEQDGTSFGQAEVRAAFRAHNWRPTKAAASALLREGASTGLWLWDEASSELVLEPGGSVDDSDDFDIPDEPSPKSKRGLVVEDNVSPADEAKVRASELLTDEEIQADCDSLMGQLFDAGMWDEIEAAAKAARIPYSETDGPKYDGAPSAWVRDFRARLQVASERV